MANEVEHLKSLHTALIDARNGYEEALEDAEGKGMSPLFREMMVSHGESADILALELRVLGEPANDDGSFMSTVHRTVMNVRSLFGGLDESILPGLIDGEKRLLSYYDEAIRDFASGSPVHAKLTGQRDALSKKIADLKLRQDEVA
jgi:uncharacterized protein (TIGR02284 family)